RMGLLRAKKPVVGIGDDAGAFDDRETLARRLAEEAQVRSHSQIFVSSIAVQTNGATAKIGQAAVHEPLYGVDVKNSGIEIVVEAVGGNYAVCLTRFGERVLADDLAAIATSQDAEPDVALGAVVGASQRIDRLHVDEGEPRAVLNAVRPRNHRRRLDQVRVDLAQH